jgi:predicted ATPase
MGRLVLVALTGVGTILSARLLVRELQNRIKRAVIMADSKRITEKDLELSSGIGISSQQL